jgi:hypothetical protein
VILHTEDLSKEGPDVDRSEANEESLVPTINDFVGNPFDLCFL